jgi:hypothetical protein
MIGNCCEDGLTKTIGYLWGELEVAALPMRHFR